MASLIRIVTANLQNGGADADAFARLLVRLRADIVCLQELTPEQCDPIAEVLPHGQLEPSNDYRGMGIALCAPARLDRIPMPFRDARVARLDPAHWEIPHPIEILNVHVMSPLVWPVYTQPALRREQVRSVLAHVEADPDQARAVLGDFNATPAWPVYRALARRLDDAVLACAREAGRTPTRTWPTWTGPLRLLRIDHCFTNRLRADAAHVVPIEGSDHCALVVDLATA